MAASKLHLTPRRLPRLCAAAPARRLPLLLARAWGSEAAQGGRTRSPLIGRVAPLIMLFHPNWAEAERSGGSWEGPTGRRGATTAAVGTEQPRLGSPYQGGREEQPGLAAPGR